MKWSQLERWYKNAWFQIGQLFWYQIEKKRMKRKAKKEGETKLGWHTEIGGKKQG
ncbi:MULTISPECIES: hypothetical protein [unclassified Spirosoma]|uniref:hypothetical protein n=1 Tax=unclassified Spirosoma TaxID=2621999 RepID=UPI000A958166|nr:MULTISPECIES: hypothetical protein [unclassified Spirosoma]MBN8825258.1 hypothetical protein [Spirosoma sp.]